MPQKTVITKVSEFGEENGIRMLFPQNRVLYADQFTGYEPDTAEEQAVFRPSTIDDVFNHYRPKKEAIFLADENGEARYEDFHFSEIEDFDDEKLISQSEILSNSVSKRDTYYSIIRHLERNRDLRKILSDPTAKTVLRDTFKAMLRELTESKKA
jgi:hypothetical protein